MINTGLVILAASPVLATAVRRVVVRQMAASIYSAPVDIDDDAAVVRHLTGAGFGSATISNLMDDARAVARMFMPGARSSAQRLLQ